MASTGSEYMEKPRPTSMDSTPIARGIQSHDNYDIERPKERKQSVVGKLKSAYDLSNTNRRPSRDGSIKQYDETHRKLKPRHIQLIGIGGTIGTALYVQIGQGLLRGGPASMNEMVTYLPISSPFIRFAGRYVDEAFGFAAGYNFFVFEAALVPFEIVACNVIIQYWSAAVPVGVIIAIVIVMYAILNIFAVKWYGESEFWLALGKVLLIIGLLAFTFVTMLGGNPLGDRFGFRYWRNPGAFNELYYGGNLGRFLGFLQCLIQASFTIAGPDYVSMAAGEAENPRWVMPRAFKAVFYRLTTFFVLGSLAVGILVPHDDAELTAAFDNGEPGAAASPYVVAMNRLRIGVLPDIVNALVLTSAFSAGNSYCYCASRSLFGLALEGKAPKILTRCTRNGVPIYCVAVVLLIALLSFLQVSNSAAVVLSWFVSLLINFAVMAFTFIKFKKACEAQGLSRDSLPYKSWWQPFCAWYAFTGCFIMAFVGGYPVFILDRWNVPTFLFSYMMIFVFPILFVGWKLIKKSKWYKPGEADLYKDVDEIEEYQRTYVPTPPRNKFMYWFDRVFS
ncbi:hypothetical protein EPUS_02545 [Endocarpon pusillum Z07020]|uniref:Amino acid permease/ SLC12A domain-containing protein n=1 Tax=Endocarpon pusillum (strain Z07020 / HMAS-L-300199) TaxID=1263415 RepID=U1HNU1_ENDPU|nr:uncharacterized protein EPUS_02545 [Endocarpon pusillum Z07020]ERF70679.1 hypothetical protein EPUS_02545 [Endocarpon pusillum Z07020]